MTQKKVDKNIVSDDRRRRVVLFGIFGIGNLGNESTLWVTLHHLRRRLPNAEVICVSDGLPSFTHQYDVTAFPIDPLPVRGARRLPSKVLKVIFLATASVLLEPIRLRRAIQMLRGTDQFIVVGTGALDDLGQLPWELPAHISRWCRAARLIRAKVQLLAVGAGPIRNRINRWLMTRAVAVSESRTYRDGYSRDYMAGLGVGSATDEVVPDLVFALPEDWLPSARAADTPPKVVGVGLMEYYGWNLTPDEGRQVYTVYIEKMAKFVRWLLDSNYCVRMLIGERHTDERAIRDLFAALGNDVVVAAGERLTAPAIESMHDLLSEITGTDMVVATRFHNLVFALALARPVISVGYAPKFESLMREMGLDEYSQHIEELDVERLQTQVRNLTTNHATAMRAALAKATEYRRRLERLYDATFESASLKEKPGAASAPLRTSAS